ncbi:MAG TPA: hypothetical protein VIR58_19565 [Acidimicrobiales bacterium]
MAVTRALLVLTVLVAAACGDDEVGIDTDQASGGVTGAAATWAVAENDPPTSDAESFTAMVERLGCSGGETGEVLEPSVAADEGQIVVTMSVEPLPSGDYTCPGNKAEPYVVELDGAIGERQLVDGACLAGEVASTSKCSDGAVRWSPQSDPVATTEAAAGQADVPAETEVFGGLSVSLLVPPSVKTGGELNTTMHVENRSDSPVTDPGCQLSNTRHALIPVDQPDADLWTVTMTDCGGPFAYEPGVVDDFTGPTFQAATNNGDPLPPGDYLAAWEMDGHRLEYPVEVTGH